MACREDLQSECHILTENMITQLPYAEVFVDDSLRGFAPKTGRLPLELEPILSAHHGNYDSALTLPTRL